MSQYSFWLERLFVNKQLSIHVYDAENFFQQQQDFLRPGGKNMEKLIKKG